MYGLKMKLLLCKSLFVSREVEVYKLHVLTTPHVGMSLQVDELIIDKDF